jgi:uncharacterized OsmC-like protein
MNELSMTLTRIGACRFVGRDHLGGASVYSGPAALADEITNRTREDVVIPEHGVPPSELSNGLRPMHAVLGSLAACGAMDTVLILAKQREPIGEFCVNVHGKRPAATPAPFEEITISVDAPGVASDRLLAAVQLAYTKYCSVASSLSPAIVINLNIGTH